MEKNASFREQKTAPSGRRKPLVFEALEARTLYSADLAAVTAMIGPPSDNGGTPVAEVRVISTSQTSPNTRATELIIVDARVQHLEQIIDTQGATILVVDKDTSIFEALARWSNTGNASASTQPSITAIHLISHGSDGQALLGNQVIDAQSIQTNAASWQALGKTLSKDADLLLYACDFAQTDRGKQTVTLLASLTQADVAASVNTSGASALGGDWEFEFSSGLIETNGLFTQEEGRFLGTLGVSSEVVSSTTLADTDKLNETSRGSSVAKLDANRTVIVWNNIDANGDQSVVGRILNDGVLGAEFKISDTSKALNDVSVAAGSDGRFVVAWRETGNSGKDNILIRRYDSAGNAVDNEKDVTPSPGSSSRQQIAVSLTANNTIGITYIESERSGSGNGNPWDLGLLVLNWNAEKISTTLIPAQSNYQAFESPAIMSTSSNDFVVAALNTAQRFSIYKIPPGSSANYSNATLVEFYDITNAWDLTGIQIANDASGNSALAFRGVNQNDGRSTIQAWVYPTEDLSGTRSLLGDGFVSGSGARSLGNFDLVADGRGNFYVTAIHSTTTPTGSGSALYAKIENSNDLVWQAFPAPPGFSFGGARATEMLIDGDQKTFLFDAQRTSTGGTTEGTIQLVRSVDIDPAIVLSSSSGVTSEDGTTYSFDVKLNRKPVGTVTITLTSTDRAEGYLDAGSGSLTFDEHNWDTYQRVVVRGASADQLIDPNHRYAIELTATDTSNDPLLSFSNKTASVAMTNTNTDTRNTILVTSTSDALHIAPTDTVETLLAFMRSNPGQVTLRDAITASNNSANGSGGADLILFASAIRDQTIALTKALPQITDKVEIVALAGKASGQGLTLSQATTLSGAQADFNLLNFASGSNGSTLSHLAIGGSAATSAAAVKVGDNNIGLYNNRIGQTSTLALAANTSTGLLIEAGTGARLVGADIRDNYISNGQVGIQANLSDSFTISGNQIVNNRDDGIRLGDVRNNINIANNTISGNSGSGIRVNSSLASGISIAQNRIGVSSGGNSAQGNSLSGIAISGGSNVVISDNTVSANGETGIRLDGGSGTSIKHNLIGVGADGATALGNGLATGEGGILVSGTVTNATITDNVIAANANAGIRLYGSGVSGVTIQSNHIGMTDSHAALANAAEGIAIHNGANNILIGGTDASLGNAINAAVNIRIFDGASSNSVLNVVILNNELTGANEGVLCVHTGDWTAPKLKPSDVNDNLDFDNGHNGLINTPVLQAERTSGVNQYEVTTSYSGLISTEFRIDYYLATIDAQSGAVTALTPLANRTVSTNGTGDASWVQQITLPGTRTSNQGFVATATRMENGVPRETSILSQAPQRSGNQAPSIPAQNASVEENATLAAVLKADDLEGDAITWTLGTAGESQLFELIGNASGQTLIQFKVPGLNAGIAPDFESATAPAGNVYSADVIATDAKGAQSTQTLRITVTNVVEAPKVLGTPPTLQIVENSVATVSDMSSTLSLWKDSSATSTFVYTVVNDAATDGALFSIPSGASLLQLRSPLDFETPSDGNRDGIYTVKIQIADSNGLSTTQTLKIQVTDVRELPLAFALPNPSSIPENSTRTWNLVGSDQDGNARLAWSISGADADKFTIDQSTGQLKLTVPIDYESLPAAKQLSVDISLVDTNDPNTVAFKRTQTFVLDISNVNESPTMTSASLVGLNENAAFNFTVLANDPDSSKVTFELDSTADASLFSLNANTGLLTLNSANQSSGLNYESSHKPDYTLRVRANDGQLQSAWQDLTVRVKDVNESPKISAPTKVSLDEDTQVKFNGSNLIKISDEDANQQYKITLTVSSGSITLNSETNDSIWFSGDMASINSALAGLKFDPAADQNGTVTLQINLQEAVASGFTQTASVTLQVNPVEDATKVVNNAQTSLAKGGTSLTSSMLKVSDVDVDSSKIIYKLGTLDSRLQATNKGKTLSAGDTFTQADIDAGDIKITPQIDFAGSIKIALTAYEQGKSGKSLSLNFTVKVDASPQSSNEATAVTTSQSNPSASSSTASSAGSPAATATKVETAKPEATKNDTTKSDASKAESNRATNYEEGSMEQEARQRAARGSMMFSASNPSASVTLKANFVQGSSNALSGPLSNPSSSPSELRSLHLGGEPTLQSHGNLGGASARVATLSSDNKSMNAVLLKNVQFAEQINEMREQVKERASLEQVVVGSSVAVSTGISLGYVIWLLRGGALLTSLFASLPAWKVLDPFPVLAGVDDSKDQEDDSLQGMLKKAAEKFKAQKASTAEHAPEATG